MQSESVAACAKHFPGHGDTNQDSHFELPVLAHGLQRLRATELPPFESAIEAGVSSIMSAHVIFQDVDPEVPATLSKRVLQELLRQELGFEGLLISDDLEMEAITSLMPIEEASLQAIEAGVDLLLCCHREDRQRAILEALIQSPSSARSLDAIDRVAEFQARFAR